MNYWKSLKRGDGGAIFLAIVFLLIGWSLLEPIVKYVQQLSESGAPVEYNWIVFAQLITFIVAATGTIQLMRNPGTASRTFAKSGVAVLVIIGVAIMVLGEDMVSDPRLQERFDPATGEPLFMVYEVEDGVKIAYLENELRRPSDCRPADVKVDGFDYSTNGTCFSSFNGTRLRPIQDTDVIVRTSLLDVADDMWSLLAGESKADSPEADTQTCPRQIDLRHLDVGQSLPICMRHRGDVFVHLPPGKRVQIQLEFLEFPVPSKPSFQPPQSERDAFVQIGRIGGSRNVDQGLSLDIARLRPNSAEFAEHGVQLHAVNFKITLTE